MVGEGGKLGEAAGLCADETGLRCKSTNHTK